MMMMTMMMIIVRKIYLGCCKLSLDQVTGLEDNEKIYVCACVFGCVCVCLRVKSGISI